MGIRMDVVNNRATRFLVSFLLLCFSFGCEKVMASPGTDWLVLQADSASGAIHTEAGTALPIQSTTEAILAFISLDQTEHPSFVPALQYVSEQGFSDTEILARKVLVAVQNKQSPASFIIQLLGHQNSDGGFGDEPGFASSVLNTSFALNAIAVSGAVVSEQVAGAVNYLLDRQLSNGGWSDGSNDASAYLTAFVINALQHYRYEYNAGPKIHTASEFLLQQLSDGVLNSDFEAAIVLLALVPVISDIARYQETLDKLRASQLSDGSWGNDVFSTALALRAIQLAESMIPPPPPEPGALTAQLISGISGAPLAGAKVTITGSENLVIQTGLNGRFLASELTPQTYTVTYEVDGFSRVTQTVDIAPGQWLDLGMVMLVAPSGSVRISGTVTDAKTGQPISADISVLGSSYATAVTDSQGSYSLNALPGAMSITVAATGYQGIVTNGTAYAGVNLDFSPALYPVGEEVPGTGVMVLGKVFDAETNTPLSDAKITVTGTTVLGTTDSSGSFSFHDLNAGDLRLEVSKDGYQPITVTTVVPGNSQVNIGTLYVLPLPEQSTTIFGIVRNQGSGAPLVDAVVQVGALSAHTDEEGFYRIKGIPLLEFDVVVTAAGYVTKTLPIHSSQYGSVQLDMGVQKIAVDGVYLNRILKDKPSYQAYEEVGLTAELENRGFAAKQITLVAEVYGPAGSYVEDFVVPVSASSRDTSLTVESGEAVSLAFTWSTRNYSPGDYQVVVKALDSGTRSVLSEEAVTLNIKETKKVSLIRILPEPSYFLRGQSGDVSVSAQIRNASNVDVAMIFNLEIKAPDGTAIYQATHDIELVATSIVTTLPLASLNHLFEYAGTYNVEISDVSGVALETFEPGSIDVAPDIRIESQLAVEPKRIIPGADRDVQIKLNIKGVESAHE